jgi:hypothetical protein
MVAQTIARPIPVLLLVTSTMVCPSFKPPLFSALLMMLITNQSLTDAARLKDSTLTQNRTSSGASLLIRIQGPLSIVSTMES